MSVTVAVDYGNGASKTFVLDELPGEVGSVVSLWDVLGAVSDAPPGLEYVFTDSTTASDRGGLSFRGRIESVDGLEAGPSGWAVYIDDVRQTDLRRAEHTMAERRESPVVEDGNSIQIKLVPESAN